MGGILELSLVVLDLLGNVLYGGCEWNFRCDGLCSWGWRILLKEGQNVVWKWSTLVVELVKVICDGLELVEEVVLHGC